MSHSPEPWSFCDESITECEVTILDSKHCERLNSEKGCQLEWAVENFPRIVACVNACRNLSDESLAKINAGGGFEVERANHKEN